MNAMRRLDFIKASLESGGVQDYERVFAVAINIQICYNNSILMRTDTES